MLEVRTRIGIATRSGAAILSTATLVTAALAPDQLSPESSTGWRTHLEIAGVQRGDRLGYAIDGRLDFDGDGTPDLLVGADGYDRVVEAANEGAVLVFSGRTGARLTSFHTPFTGTRLGHSVAWIGDVDADGVPDALAGGPFLSVPGSPYLGYAAVFSGATGEVVHEYVGSHRGAQLAHAVTDVGDVDGDQVPDFAIGTPWAMGQRLGGVTVHSGKTGKALWRHRGPEAWCGMGYDLDRIGDLDDDGIDDLVAGAHGGFPWGMFASRGRVRLLSGADGTVLHEFVEERENAETRPHDQFGFANAAIGDLDGDGLDDVLIGAPYTDVDGEADRGAVYAYSSVTGARLRTWTGRPGERCFGRDVLGVGDQDHDGVDDVLIGSGYYQPFPHLSEPYRFGTCHLYSGATGELLGRYTGTSPCHVTGSFLGPVGDLDGDGREEFATGMPYRLPECDPGAAGGVLVASWSG